MRATAAGDNRLRALLPLAALAIWMAVTPGASAHAVVEGSEPPANARLETTPRRVVVWLNERVEPSFTSMTVLDEAGDRVSTAPVLSADGRRITVELVRGSPGVYVVRWRVLSAVDGHLTSGVFAFAVGRAMPSARAAPQVAAPGALRITVRWTGLLAAILLAGSLVFHTVVFRPGLARIGRDDAERIEALAWPRLRWLARGAAAVLLGSVAAEYVLQATELLDGPLWSVLATGRAAPLLFGTKAGWSVVVRAAMALVVLLPVPRTAVLQRAILAWVAVFGAAAAMAASPAAAWGHRDALASSLPYGAVLLAVGVVLPKLLKVPEVDQARLAAALVLPAGFTVASHAAGAGALAALADWVHMVAAAAWIGGLATLLLLLVVAGAHDRQTVARTLVPRFSVLAGASLGALLVTGAYSAWLQVPTLRAFIGTQYGRVLLAKLMLVAVLAALGTVNHRVLRPRIVASDRADAVRRLIHSTGGEMALGAAVLLVVAVLTIIPTARATAPQTGVGLAVSEQTGLILAGVAGDVNVRLSLSPARPGWNLYEVVATDARGRPLQGRTLLRLVKLDQDLAPATLVLRDQGGGRFAAEGGELSLPGWWEAVVVARRPGRLDASVSFPLHLGQADTGPSDSAALRLLRQAEEAMAKLTSWRQVEQLTDGSGNVVVTRYEVQRPDRLRFRTSTNAEAVIIGATRYTRSDGGPWERDTLPQPFSVGEYIRAYTLGAAGARLGREGPCDGERCRVVRWALSDGRIALAAWIGLDTYRMRGLLMAARGHYMTVRFADFNVAVRIAPPK